MWLTICLAIEPHLRGRWTDWPVFLGDASYAIYLTHGLILVVLAWGFQSAGLVVPYPAFVPVLIIIALVAGAVVHQHVALPLLRGLRRLHRVKAVVPA